jgi:hypothetical protein
MCLDADDYCPYEGGGGNMTLEDKIKIRSLLMQLHSLTKEQITLIHEVCPNFSEGIPGTSVEVAFQQLWEENCDNLGREYHPFALIGSLRAVLNSLLAGLEATE